jgi:hypothetical protein
MARHRYQEIAEDLERRTESGKLFPADRNQIVYDAGTVPDRSEPPGSPAWAPGGGAAGRCEREVESWAS